MFLTLKDMNVDGVSYSQLDIIPENVVTFDMISNVEVINIGHMPLKRAHQLLKNIL